MRSNAVIFSPLPCAVRCYYVRYYYGLSLRAVSQDYSASPPAGSMRSMYRCFAVLENIPEQFSAIHLRVQRRRARYHVFISFSDNIRHNIGFLFSWINARETNRSRVSVYVFRVALISPPPPERRFQARSRYTRTAIIQREKREEKSNRQRSSTRN